MIVNLKYKTNSWTKEYKNLLKRTNGKGLNELTSSDISNWIKKNKYKRYYIK